VDRRWFLRRLLATASGASAATAAAAACRPGGTREGAGPAALPVPRTVEYWSRYGAGVALQTQNELIDQYQARHPGVTVTATPVTQGIHEKTVAAVAAGTPPDVSNYDRFLIASVAVQGTFTPLDDLARRDGIGEREYYPMAWREAGYRGKLLALPYQTGVRALYFNRAHLQESGFNPDQPPRILTELDQWALRLTKQEGDRYARVGFIPWIGNSHFYTWGWLFGGEFYDEKSNRCTANQPPIVRALEWVGGYAQRYGDARLRAFEGTFGQVSGGPFLGGLVGFFHTIQSLLDEAPRLNPQLDFGVTPLPPAPGQTKTSTWSGGFGYVIPRGARQVEAGWHLMKFLGSDEGELHWTRGTLSLPVRVNVARSAYWQERGRDPRMMVFLDLLPGARWRPVMPAAQLLFDELNAAVQQVRTGALFPKDALDGVTRRVNLELAKYDS
jgi:multiple sugar transport system substrate-binding protein